MFGYDYDGVEYFADEETIENSKYKHNRYYYNENPTDVEELINRKKFQKAVYEAMLISVKVKNASQNLTDYDAMLLGLK